MDIIKINKVLCNETRVEILRWLKDPATHFPPHIALKHFNFGVCAQYIQEKTNLSQSTISLYLRKMEQADLVIPTRVGKWTYFKRNEKTIKAYKKAIDQHM